MDERKSGLKWWGLGILVFLVVVAVTVVVGYRLGVWRSNVLTQKEVTPMGAELLVDKPKTVLVGDPIQKTYGKDSANQTVKYQVDGNFVDQLYFGKDGILRGKFVVSGDPLKRELLVLVGTGDGKIYLGKYESDLMSSAEWRDALSTEAQALATPKKQVRLRFELSNGDDDNQKRVEMVLDQMIDEFHTGDFKLEIPVQFAIYTMQLGVSK